MDNFRQPKRPKPRVTMDGIIGKPAGPTAPGQHPRVPGLPVARQKKARPVVNFRKPEGFHSSRPTVINPTSRGNPEPNDDEKLLADLSLVPPVDAPTGKRRRWGHRKAAKKPISTRRKIIKRIFLTLLILVLLIGGFLALKVYQKQRKVLKGGGNGAALQENVDPTQLNGEGDGRVNIILLGKGGEGHQGADLTDTILVASIDPVHKDAALVSIPRDLWVKPPGSSSYEKINSVYPNAKNTVLNGRTIPNQEQKAEEVGINALQKTVEDFLGIPVHYHVMVDFTAFQEAIDTVGGITLNVDTPLYDRMALDGGKPYILNVGAGPQAFDGLRALMYARSRHTSARGDFDRSERQRKIIIALKDKVLSAGTYGNPIKISQLLDNFGDHVEADFTLGEIKRLYEIGKQIPGNKITSVGLADPPNSFLRTDSVGGLSVVVPTAGIGNYGAIQSFIRNSLKDSYIKDENANITVLNGTNIAGLATKRSEELKSFGYNVGTVGDAPTKDYTATTLVDLRSGAKKYTQHYLEKRLGIKATTKLPAGITPGTADFVIILGPNETATSS